MNILYIGQYTSGTTSKMRAEQLKEIIHTSPLGNREVNFNVIDTHIPFNNTTRLWRSIGFRYKCCSFCLSKEFSINHIQLNQKQLRNFFLVGCCETFTCLSAG